MTTKKTRPVKARDIRVGHVYYVPFNGEFKATTLAHQPVVELIIQSQPVQRAVRAMVEEGGVLYRSKAKAKRIGFNI